MLLPRAWKPRCRAALAGAAALLLSGGCASSLLLHPTTHALPTPGMERTVVACDDGDLEVWVTRTRAAESGAADFAVLAFNGNADRAERNALGVLRLLGDRAAEVWAVNYPGFGGSDGSASLGAIRDAALAAHDALAARGLPVVCWGESIGSTAALHVAAERDVAGVVVRNPPPLQRLVLVRHGWWNLWLAAIPVWMQIPGELNALDTAPRVTEPSVFLMSLADQVVPVSYQFEVFAAYGGPKQGVPLPGGHNDLMRESEILIFRQELDALVAPLLATGSTPDTW